MTRNVIPPEVVNDINELLNTLNNVNANTDDVEAKLDDVISELQDIEIDVESVDLNTDEVETKLDGVISELQDIDANTDTVESELQDINTELDNIDTYPGGDFDIDEDNTTSTVLSAGEEFVGEWNSWDDYIGLSVALVADVPGGVDSAGSGALKIDFSNDINSGPGNTKEVDYPVVDGQVGEGIQPLIPREAENYRVRYQNGDQDQSLFRLTTTRLPRQLIPNVLPIEDSVRAENVAELVKSVITARQPDGDYANIGANRKGDLKTEIDSVGNNAYRHAPRGDVSLYGSQITASKVPQIERQFWTDDPNNDLDTTHTGSAFATSEQGYAQINSGTNANASFDGQTFKSIDYLTSAEIKVSFASAWIQPPTSAGDYSTIGISNGDDGFEIGYKGTEFGIRRLRAGVEQDFVPQSEFNIDKLDGNPESEYERNDSPVAINHQTQDMWRIRYGWYGVAPTHIEVLAPDGHWVAVHKFDFTDETIPQTEQPNLPVRTFIEKTSSDSTNIQQNINAFYGGIKANVSLSQQPDGDYVPSKATGEAFRTEELLTANEEYVGPWLDTDGWASIGLNIDSDQVSAENGVVVEFSEDIQAETPPTDASATFTYTQEDIDGDTSLYILLETQLDGFRVRYQNGPTGQNEFDLTGTLFTDPRGRKTNLATPVPNDAVVETQRAIVFARNDDGDIEEVRKPTGADEGVRTTVSRHETDTPHRPDDVFDTEQVNVPDADGGGPIRILNDPISNRTTVRLENEGTAPVFMGADNTLDVTNGYQIDPNSEYEFPLSEDASIWVIAEDGVGGSTTYTLDPTAADTSGTATNADNVVLSDDIRATFDADGELVDASGYDASGVQSRDVVSNVKIGFEGRRAAGGAQTITHEQSVSNIQVGGTSITTNNALISDTEGYYTAFISIRPQDRSVTSMNGLGLDWQFRTSTINSGGVKTEVWTGVGEPTSGGTVTANFNNTVTTSSIGVSRWSGVDLSDPIQSVGGTTGTTAAWSATPASNTTGDRIVGGAGVIIDTTNDPGGDDIEHLDTSIGGNNAERLTFAVQSREAAANNTLTDGSWGVGGAWASTALALNQAPLSDPIMELSYEVNTEGTGDTTLSVPLDNESDETFTTDVTGDRAWSYTDIDNSTLTLVFSDTNTADAEIDHMFIEFTESDNDSAQRVSVIETGRSGSI